MIKKLTFISDTHGRHRHLSDDLPGGDFLLHSGDISSRGYTNEIKNFLDWFSDQDYTYKVFIAGNHDWGFETSPAEVNMLLQQYDVIYLEDSFIEIEDIKIYGSPWQPAFNDWAFNLPRQGKKLREKFDLIPQDLDILLTHGPPFGVLDYVIWSGTHVGCEILANRIPQINPKIHSFGHIHNSGTKQSNSTFHINAANLDERYEYNYRPINVTYNTQTRTIEDYEYSRS